MKSTPVFKTAILAGALTAVAVTAPLSAQTPSASPADLAKTANPELVGQLAKELNATPAQAAGAAGALFRVAKNRLPANDWSKLAAVVPGMDGLLGAAPAEEGEKGAEKGDGPLAGALGGRASNLASAAAAFKRLGLEPGMVGKAVPILVKYVTGTGGAGIGSLLMGALK
jgi:hypothetical protein